MRVFFVLLGGIFLFVCVLVYAAITNCFTVTSQGENVWVETYFLQARIPMFTGFLTLGSFLLTLQTAIIQRLKDGFDTEDYKTRYLAHVEKQKTKRTSKPIKYYGSLERMSVALSTNVILALSTAAAQLSIGFLRTPESTAICIGLAASSVLLVIYLTIELLSAHREWFKKIETERQNVINPPKVN